MDCIFGGVTDHDDRIIISVIGDEVLARPELGPGFVLAGGAEPLEEVDVDAAVGADAPRDRVQEEAVENRGLE